MKVQRRADSLPSAPATFNNLLLFLLKLETIQFRWLLPVCLPVSPGKQLHFCISLQQHDKVIELLAPTFT